MTSLIDDIKVEAQVEVLVWSDIVKESMKNITEWGIRHRVGQARALVEARRTGRWNSL